MPECVNIVCAKMCADVNPSEDTITVRFFTSVIILAVLEVLKLLDFEYMAFEESEIPYVSQIHVLIMSWEGKRDGRVLATATTRNATTV